MNPVMRISPISDADVAGLTATSTMADLAEAISRTPVRGGAGPARRKITLRRAALIGFPVAGAMAVGGLVASSLSSTGAKVGQGTVGPLVTQAAVMSVTRHGGYLDVIVNNPLADARKYRAEFRKLGLNITLTLVPASPSLVGTLVYFASPATIKPITAVGKCFTGGGGNVCPVGVSVPLHFKGSAVLTFGRAAQPGERYETTAAVTARGEAMHRMTFVGKTAGAVTAMLGRRHVSVGDYRYYRYTSSRCVTINRKAAPGSWYVTGADPWAPGEVSLDVSKTWPARSCPSAPGPTPQPTATRQPGSGTS